MRQVDGPCGCLESYVSNWELTIGQCPGKVEDVVKCWNIFCMHPGSLIEATQILMQLIRGGYAFMLIAGTACKCALIELFRCDQLATDQGNNTKTYISVLAIVVNIIKKTSLEELKNSLFKG